MYAMVVTLDTAPHAAWFVLLLLLLWLFMVMMDRRMVDGTRVRQAKGIHGEDTNERHPRVALLTIPTGDILIEGGGAVEHGVHGRHPRYCTHTPMPRGSSHWFYMVTGRRVVG